MTLTLPPADPADLYALMGASALLAHIKAAAEALARTVDLTAAARTGLEEIEEAVLEHLARTDPLAFRREAAVRDALATGARP